MPPKSRANPPSLPEPVIHPWEGDVSEPCHRHFVPRPPSPLCWPEVITQTAEVLIVGAGLSGLTAAYHLKDLDVLVLEAEPHAGGVCLGGRAAGISYPAGSAYSYYPWDEAWAAWYKGLNLDVEQALVRPPASALYYRGDWYPDCYSEAGVRRWPVSLAARDKLAALAADLAAWEEAWDPLGSDRLTRSELDLVSLAAYLEQERGLPPEATALFAPYCASCLGALPHQVSAWAGLTFLMSEFSTTSRIIAFPEGNARLVQVLTAALPRPPRLGQTVLGLKPAADGVRVLAADSSGRELTCLQAGVVILAGGKFSMRHLLAPGCGWEAADFSHFRYSSYVVAALQGSLPLTAPGYENWVAEDPTLTDFILAPREAAAGEPKVMVIYSPQPFPEGRAALLSRSAPEQAGLLLTAGERLHPGLSRAVAEVRLYRFGHAQVVPYPGFLTTLKQSRRPAPRQGRLILANADLEGLPCVEAAIIQGQKAARRAREVLQDLAV